MATYRFPVLVWEDFEGYFTASLAEWDERAALGRSAADVLGQLQDYLVWLYQNRPYLGAPDFLDPELLHFRVPVRPEYRLDGRPSPCDESLALAVPCVRGRQEGGLLVASLPTLDLRFYYYQADSLKALVTRYVQQKLQGLTPRELSRHLPPRSVLLEEVVVRVARKEDDRRPELELLTLGTVAEPLGERGVRRQFARAWEREAEVAAVVQKLGKEKVNVLLVGEPGCGKTTVLVQAVQALEKQPAEEDEEKEKTDVAIPKRRFWLTSGARLIAGMKYLGQWEERCEEVIEELARIDGVLCVADLLDLVRTGGLAPGSSVAAFFIPYLQRGELRLAGEATPAELDACRRLLPGLADLFQIINLPPFGRKQALTVLDRLATTLKQELRLEPARGVIDLVYRLFRRFAPYDAFPGKAAGFLAELFDRVSREKAAEVTTDHVLEHFIRQTGLPELFLRDELPLEHAEVVETFRAQVIGQEGPCRTAADLVTTFKAGLNDPGRPVGVLLFCGPTGVGKTELAKALSRYFFGHGENTQRLIRLDMSEYTGFGAAERLVSQPNGRPSNLIQKIRQQPFVVLLLDEVEKADPEVFDVLLSVFDEGRLTDRYGRVTNFRSAVIVMTSNLGAGRQEAFGFGKERAVHYDAEALAFFRPEFFNRIDAVVTFDPLGPETVLAITRKELGEIARREGLARANLRLAWTDRLVAHLARVGFDARYGARPLQRTLETLVVTPLARHLLEHPGLRAAEIHMDLGEQGEVVFL
jgi:ATP-dependent Clp protease ATP-binding subunit ClpC